MQATTAAAPHVARRICLLGGESTGKTSLAEALAQVLDEPWVPEYGRELWEARGGSLEFEELLHIARVQVAREEQAERLARQYLVCDTSPLTTLFYSLELFGRADPRLEALARRPYDLVVLCGEDFAFVQDGWRRDPDFRHRGQSWYQERLAEYGMSWFEVHGPLADRVRRMRELLLMKGLR